MCSASNSPGVRTSSSLVAGRSLSRSTSCRGETSAGVDVDIGISLCRLDVQLNSRIYEPSRLRKRLRLAFGFFRELRGVAAVPGRWLRSAPRRGRLLETAVNPADRQHRGALIHGSFATFGALVVPSEARNLLS